LLSRALGYGCVVVGQQAEQAIFSSPDIPLLQMRAIGFDAQRYFITDPALHTDLAEIDRLDQRPRLRKYER